MKNRHVLDVIVVILVVSFILLVRIPYVTMIVSCIAILTYSHFKSGIKLELGFNLSSSVIKTVATSLFIALLIASISFFILIPIITHFTGDELLLGVFDQLRGNSSLFISSIVIGWVIGGISEEIIFRGFFISRLMSVIPGRLGAIVAILLTSIVFGYLHNYQGLTGQILNGCVGVILGTMYVLNGKRIWGNILTHGLLNTSSMILLYMGWV